MTRREDWRPRLAAYVRDHRFEPHGFGSLDCWLFVAGAIEVMTGQDYAALHRGRYKTARGALGVMKRARATNMAEFAGLFLAEVAPINAQIGDVMAVPTDDAFGFALGLLNGERILVLTPAGIETRDRSEAVRAFEV